ncbi:gliding motility-associated C-terminal domain-containing protein [Pedobacter duraquae]|uniref:Gliding motility-associated-like protein/predicted secreted protein (Por secretion system target) n=1 Tax=Pedobacter duraquae TaxID=425511 RepID=A0A4R6IKG0_9SPHI|nr:gliding motility-associated C-terminal domain-containing protein [Pedobacter duraquae]TDO22511.1 gliding motility-associated-like protein/predicted secreted protein (Por secretion system target) [Pedobacter duraquae]
MQSKSMRLLFIALLIGGSVHAQQNTVTAGGDAVGSGGTSSYSIGQVFYTVLSAGSTSVGAGVQQTYTEAFSSLNLKQYVLNVLSPNGDGKNDAWVIKNIDDYPNNTVSVYDRSGRQVFNEKSYKNTWNGTYNGTPLAEGVYFYVIEYGNGIAPLKGALNILYRKN